MQRVRRCYFLWTTILAASVGLSPAALAGDSAEPAPGIPTYNVADAVREVKRTKRPVFAVSYSDTCPVCQGLLRTLAKEDSLQPIAAQFVNVRINVESPEFRAWESRYPRPSTAIPGVYVIDASGKAIDLRAGGQTVDNLRAMLTAGLKQAGRMPRPDQLQTLAEAAEKARPRVDAGNFHAARASFELVQDELVQLYDGLALSDEGQKIREVVDAIVADGKQRLDVALASSADDWTTAWAIASVAGDFEKFPGLAAEIDDATSSFSQSAAQKVMLRQAGELYRVKQLYGADRSERGRKALLRIEQKYSGKPVAKMAADILIGRDAEKPAAPAGVLRIWTDASGRFSVEARFDRAAVGKVRLLRRDGKAIEVPFDNLSDADQKFVEAQAQAL